MTWILKSKTFAGVEVSFWILLLNIHFIYLLGTDRKRKWKLFVKYFITEVNKGQNVGDVDKS